MSGAPIPIPDLKLTNQERLEGGDSFLGDSKFSTRSGGDININRGITPMQGLLYAGIGLAGLWIYRRFIK